MNPSLHQSAFRPVIREPPIVEQLMPERATDAGKEDNSDDEVDIETTEDDPVTPLNASLQNLHSASNSAMSNHSGRSTSPQCWSPPRETVSRDSTQIDRVISATVYPQTHLLRSAWTKYTSMQLEDISPHIFKYIYISLSLFYKRLKVYKFECVFK